MEFSSWLKEQTGLTVYDFITLKSKDFPNPKDELKRYIKEWIDKERPSDDFVIRAYSLIE